MHLRTLARALLLVLPIAACATERPQQTAHAEAAAAKALPEVRYYMIADT